LSGSDGKQDRKTTNCDRKKEKEANGRTFIAVVILLWVVSLCDNASYEANVSSISYDPTTADNSNPTDGGEGAASDGINNANTLKDPIVSGIPQSHGSIFSDPNVSSD
jgi:hypothetical protein